MAKAEKENPKKDAPKELTEAVIKEKIKERGQTLQQLQAKSQQQRAEITITVDQINQVVGAIKQLQDLLPRPDKVAD